MTLTLQHLLSFRACDFGTIGTTETSFYAGERIRNQLAHLHRVVTAILRKDASTALTWFAAGEPSRSC